ncbi:replication factor-A protein [Cercophora scortea]|uniref:Replication factor-A protein n=1 Tax=Cercophora scortea TaxID=314031 RepID=A0AAE0M8L6_9PEZI|nr:replication factor-A protein [Cercophora scortea]
MASYGGYTKTGYGTQAGNDGGGFMGASQQGSQGGGSKSYSDDSLRPVTIKQLVDCEEAYPGADLEIDGIPITQVTVVGQVRAVNPQATNITYKLDDGTATMDVKKWVDAEKADDNDPKFAPDTYVRVWGRLKNFNGKKHIGAHFIRAIDDGNEVSYHLLEAAYVHLYFTKGAAAAGGGGNAAGGGDSMFVDGGGYTAGGNGGAVPGGGAGNARLAKCSRNAQSMFNYLNNSPEGNEGMHLNTIATNTGMSVRDVLGAADELLGSGLVYTTIDDETWAILDY